ncbi:MAG: hypothetical protein ACPLY8_05860, partial [Thermogutta sp.]
MTDDRLPSETSGWKPSAEITVSDFQRLIRNMYYEKDVARGIEGTFMWLVAEIGELAEALRNGTRTVLAAWNYRNQRLQLI